MVDRTPQQFPGGEPDGVTDNTAAIQAAIDAWQPGDRVVISGGEFRTSATLQVGQPGLVIRGDGIIRAMGSQFAPGTAMLRIAAASVLLDLDGLTLDQNTNMQGGISIQVEGSAGAEILGLVSRQTVHAAIRLGDFATELLVDGMDHVGRGYGILAADPQGMSGITIRRSTFEHVGDGVAGDGVELNCPTFGASNVSIVACTARGHIGVASNAGIGFGFARVTDGRIVGCRAESCEGDGIHLEHLSHRWLVADCRVQASGAGAPDDGNGSGIIAYDSDDVTVILCHIRDAGAHGIALSGQGSQSVASQLRLNGLIERCSIDLTRRDGIHVTAQREFRIDRNFVRDPSRNNPGVYAGIHAGQQGGTTLENVNGSGTGNVIATSGQTTPLADVVVRPASLEVEIEGVVGNESRAIETGEQRITEEGEFRALEFA